jgi:hypothetical protein
MTGLATGPHLDLRIQLHGQFLNFEKLPLLPTEPVAQRDWNEFAAVRDYALACIPPASEQPTFAKSVTPAPSAVSAASVSAAASTSL